MSEGGRPFAYSLKMDAFSFGEMGSRFGIFGMIICFCAFADDFESFEDGAFRLRVASGKT